MITIAQFNRDEAPRVVMLYYNDVKTDLFRYEDYMAAFTDKQRGIHLLKGEYSGVQYIDTIRRRQRKDSVQYTINFYDLPFEYNMQVPRGGMNWLDDAMKQVSTESQWPELRSPADLLNDLLGRK